ncbi:MAG: peptide chain release factor N(5)-glutamine methyltransferase [Bacillota bacterium]|nr:peptide chain release factor N(5)-glutamine methyltransferase [Bacillota bacterium]
MRVSEAKTKITAVLTSAGIAAEEAAFEARLFLSAQLGCALSELPLQHAAEIDMAALAPQLRRRIAGEPLQYILGETEFMGLRLISAPAALNPRGDSEALIEAAIELARGWDAPRIADICTGGGAFALALAHYLPQARLYAVDISAQALALARDNAAALGLGGRIDFYQGDLLEPLAARGLRFELIVANPPYIPTAELEYLPPEVRHEPVIALDGGADGLDFYRRLAQETRAALADGGYLLLEHGCSQAAAVSELLREQGFGIARVINDWGGRERGVLAKSGRSGGRE